MVCVVASTDLETALDQAPGTVTAFLEHLVGEPVDAQRRRHQAARADSSNALRVADGHPLLRRAAVLEGRRSGTPYLYAETLLVPGRLSVRFRERLDSSPDPIGRLLVEEGISVTREILTGSDRGVVSVPSDPDAASGWLLARTYRADVDGSPIMMVAEWFLPSLEEFLPA
jgi:chorismate lyase